MRVYELAKMLGVESRVLIPELIRLGIEVTSHSNALHEDSVQKAVKAMAEKGVTIQPGQSVQTIGKKKAGSAKHSLKVSDGSTKGREEKKRGQKSTSLLESEEPPKHEKKRILFKRRKDPPVLSVDAPDELLASEEDAEQGSSDVMPVEPMLTFSQETMDPFSCCRTRDGF